MSDWEKISRPSEPRRWRRALLAYLHDSSPVRGGVGLTRPTPGVPAGPSPARTRRAIVFPDPIRVSGRFIYRLVRVDSAEVGYCGLRAAPAQRQMTEWNAALAPEDERWVLNEIWMSHRQLRRMQKDWPHLDPDPGDASEEASRRSAAPLARECLAAEMPARAIAADRDSAPTRLVAWAWRARAAAVAALAWGLASLHPHRWLPLAPLAQTGFAPAFA